MSNRSGLRIIPYENWRWFEVSQKVEQPEIRHNTMGFAAGDAEIRRELLRAQIPRLYALFLNRWPNPSPAEEPVQKTVFDAVRGLSTYEPARRGPEEWLFGIRTGADRILNVIKDKAACGITLTPIGFGMGNYNDVLMEQLADKGNGQYAYVDTIAEAGRDSRRCP